MSKKRPRIVTGLDIGTTKICAIIGTLDDDGKIRILGVGSNPSLGLKKGMVVDINLTVESIQKAVAKAEEMAGHRVEEVYVGIAGGHINSINSMNSRALIPVANTLRGVTEQDRLKVIAKAREVQLPANDEIIHEIPQEYICDGQPGIKNPVGMSSNVLEVKVHLVTAAISSATNIVRCINLAGLRTCDILLESLASSLAVLTDNERELGVVLIDIGGGTSDVAVFSNGSVTYSGVIPLGGDSVTKDIVVGLKINRYDAENLKKKHASAMLDGSQGDEVIELLDTANDTTVTANRRFLCEISEARLEQIFLMTKQMLESSPARHKTYAGIVLTGGTSLMKNITELAERLFETNVKIGTPLNLKGMTGVTESPIYATAIGLVIHGLTAAPNSSSNLRNVGWWGKLWAAVKKFIDWYS